jgi:hypothetical protein
MYIERLLKIKPSRYSKIDITGPLGFIGIAGFEQHPKLAFFQKSCNCV